MLKYNIVKKIALSLVGYMVEQLCGIIAIILGIWEIYSVHKTFSEVKRHGNENTSGFLPLALWSGIVVSLAFIIIGICLILKLW